MEKLIMVKKMDKALNKQLNREIFSAYLYLSMSAYFESINLTGMANWMNVQAKEEMTHAMKFYNYILQCGEKVLLDAVEKPQSEWESPLKAFEGALEHEKYITKNIYDLVTLARDEKDYATEIFLNWFVTEQMEEEDNASKIIEKLKLIQDSPNGLYLLDKELSLRQFVDETAATSNA